MPSYLLFIIWLRSFKLIFVIFLCMHAVASVDLSTIFRFCCFVQLRDGSHKPEDWDLWLPSLIPRIPYIYLLNIEGSFLNIAPSLFRLVPYRILNRRSPSFHSFFPANLFDINKGLRSFHSNKSTSSLPLLLFKPTQSTRCGKWKNMFEGKPIYLYRSRLVQTMALLFNPWRV